MKPEFNERADELIADGRWAESRTMLETAIREMPADWKPCCDDEQALTIAFWDQGEFLAYVDHHGSGLTKPIFWVSGSYSKAWYQLAVVSIEQAQLEDAQLRHLLDPLAPDRNWGWVASPIELASRECLQVAGKAEPL